MAKSRSSSSIKRRAATSTPVQVRKTTSVSVTPDPRLPQNATQVAADAGNHSTNNSRTAGTRTSAVYYDKPYNTTSRNRSTRGGVDHGLVNTSPGPARDPDLESVSAPPFPPFGPTISLAAVQLAFLPLARPGSANTDHSSSLTSIASLTTIPCRVKNCTAVHLPSVENNTPFTLCFNDRLWVFSKFGPPNSDPPTGTTSKAAKHGKRRTATIANPIMTHLVGWPRESGPGPAPTLEAQSPSEPITILFPAPSPKNDIIPVWTLNGSAMTTLLKQLDSTSPSDAVMSWDPNWLAEYLDSTASSTNNLTRDSKSPNLLSWLGSTGLESAPSPTKNSTGASVTGSVNTSHTSRTGTKKLTSNLIHAPKRVEKSTPDDILGGPSNSKRHRSHHDDRRDDRSSSSHHPHVQVPDRDHISIPGDSTATDDSDTESSSSESEKDSISSALASTRHGKTGPRDPSSRASNQKPISDMSHSSSSSHDNDLLHSLQLLVGGPLPSAPQPSILKGKDTIASTTFPRQILAMLSLDATKVLQTSTLSALRRFESLSSQVYPFPPYDAPRILNSIALPTQDDLRLFVPLSHRYASAEATTRSFAYGALTKDTVSNTKKFSDLIKEDSELLRTGTFTAWEAAVLSWTQFLTSIINPRSDVSNALTRAANRLIHFGKHNHMGFASPVTPLFLMDIAFYFSHEIDKLLFHATLTDGVSHDVSSTRAVQLLNNCPDIDSDTSIIKRRWQTAHFQHIQLQDPPSGSVRNGGDNKPGSHIKPSPRQGSSHRDDQRLNPHRPPGNQHPRPSDHPSNHPSTQTPIRSRLPTKDNTLFCFYYNSTKGCGRGDNCSLPHRQPSTKEEAEKFQAYIQSRSHLHVSPTLVPKLDKLLSNN